MVALEVELLTARSIPQKVQQAINLAQGNIGNPLLVPLIVLSGLFQNLLENGGSLGQRAPLLQVFAHDDAFRWLLLSLPNEVSSHFLFHYECQVFRYHVVTMKYLHRNGVNLAPSLHR